MLSNKQIIYDGNCPICRAGIRNLIRIGVLPEAKAVAFDELAPALRPQVDAERFRNEMAMIDLQGGPTQYGQDAALYLFAARFSVIRPLARSATFRNIVRPLYKLIAFNRYVMSTPFPRPVRCSCEPESPPAYRVAWLILCAIASVIITAAFGASLAPYFSGLSPVSGAIGMLLIAGTGWLLTLLLARSSLDNWLEYSAHLGSVMLRGVLVLVPFIIWENVTDFGWTMVPIVSVVLSSLYMFRQHITRIRYLFLSTSWQWIWFGSLQATAATWIWIFWSYM